MSGRITRISLFGLLLCASLALASSTTQPSAGDMNAPSPKPELTPDQVVRIQVNAMKDNDKPAPDAGIATTFRFASPGNKQKTGPLEQFIKMVKGPEYGILINCQSAEFGDPHVVENVAKQFVRITGPKGDEALFMFVLSKQDTGDFKNCWMTDGVIRLRPEEFVPAPPPPGNNGDGRNAT